MICFNKRIPKFSLFIFKHGPETGKERVPSVPTGDKSNKGDVDKRSKNVLGGAMKTCDEFSCRVEIKKESWQERADNILKEIQADPSLRLAFNTFLREYARVGGVKSEDINMVGDVSENFYFIISGVGVPNSEIGFNTAWNDILRVAQKGVKGSKEKWPYERLKSVIDSGGGSKAMAKK